MLAARGVTTSPAANTVEVFIDDKPIQVDPGCTVLQVVTSHKCLFVCCLCLFIFIRHEGRNTRIEKRNLNNTKTDQAERERENLFASHYNHNNNKYNSQHN